MSIRHCLIAKKAVIRFLTDKAIRRSQNWNPQLWLFHEKIFLEKNVWTEHFWWRREKKIYGQYLKNIKNAFFINLVCIRRQLLEVQIKLGVRGGPRQTPKSERDFAKLVWFTGCSVHKMNFILPARLLHAKLHLNVLTSRGNRRLVRLCTSARQVSRYFIITHCGIHNVNFT